MHNLFPDQQPTIISKDNKFFKLAQALKLNKNKLQQEYFLVEGEKSINSLGNKFKALAVLLPENSKSLDLKSLPESFIESLNCSCHFFSETLWQKMSDLQSPSKIMAIFERPTLPFPEEFVKSNAQFVLVLDTLQDPGNMGTLFRTAVAAGWQNIVCLRGCVDAFSSKVIRASAGAVAGLNIYQDVLAQELAESLKAQKFKVFITSSHNSILLNELDLTFGSSNKDSAKLALVLGNEGQGVTPDLLKKLTELCEVQQIKIPMENSPHIESLNVSIAGALLMYKLRHLI